MALLVSILSEDLDASHFDSMYDGTTHVIFRNHPICAVSTSHELQGILARSTAIIFLLFPAVA